MTNNRLELQLANLLRRRQLSKCRRQQRQGNIFGHVLTNSETIDNPNFGSISSADLGLLFQATDEAFFDGLVGQLCEQRATRPLAFRLSTRMTSAGGMTTMQSLGKRFGTEQFEFEIAIATTPLFSSFRQTETIEVGGTTCRNRLEALQRIMEHEMVHLIEMLIWKDSNCSARRFKGIVKEFFGHLESNHQLLTPRDLARKELGITPGDTVTFSLEGQKLQGHVNSINKRATILVQDSSGTLYDDGLRYAKYYVPLHQLKRA